MTHVENNEKISEEADIVVDRQEEKIYKYYMDSNFDWSFIMLRPHIVNLLQSDDILSMKKRTEDADTSKSYLQLPLGLRKISQSKHLRVHFSFQQYNLNAALEDMDSWNFNIFESAAIVGQHIMVPLAKRILMSHGLLYKFQISSDLCEAFLIKVEKHYRHNPFHNSIHGTDVMQTVNCIMVQTGFISILDDMEILCILLTALMHDIEHTGTNNNFHRNSRSEMAKLYMVSVLENHHLRVALGLLRLYDILAILTEAEYEEFKYMLCCMILSTDMSNHFTLITNMKIISGSPTKCSSRIRIRRVLMLLLHAADISNPAKPWDTHKIWVSLLTQEYFDQGDKEKKMNLPISPNCDKLTVNIAALQIGFIQTFAMETFDVLYSLMKMEITDASGKITPYNPWVQCMKDNTIRWSKNWNSMKYAFINELLSDKSQPRNSVMGEVVRRKKKKKRSKWLCCCRERHEGHLFNLSECSSATPL